MAAAIAENSVGKKATINFLLWGNMTVEKKQVDWWNYQSEELKENDDDNGTSVGQ
jgi:hypothetical protein